MASNPCKEEIAGTNEDIIDVKQLKKQGSYPVIEAQKPFSGGHALPIPDRSLACISKGPDNIEIGCLYEIDHKKLPPKSPVHLKTIRVVLVTEITQLTVTVNYPSTLSLCTYFSRNSGVEMSDYNLTEGERHPKLDERFVMRANLAEEILVHQTSPPEFSKHEQLRGFWLVSPIGAESSNPVLCERSPKDEASVKGNCLSTLNCAGLVHWGIRRRVTFVGRHSEKTPIVPSLTSLSKEVAAVTTDTDTKNELEKIRKRRPENSSYNTNIKATKLENNPPNISATTVNPKNSGRQKLKVSYDRWSKERYKSAEVKMLEILKESGAVFGKPILRQTLRMEARKHIGDTGLLDHLLKHMAGKVAPNGEERFRRRHNADGAMEYWLESADLVNIRREAGVNDPYWTPPPGWRPGDSPSQDPICAKELKLLKEEMASIKKDLQVLVETKRKEGVHEEANKTSVTKSCVNNSKASEDAMAVMQKYENLVKRRKELEEQLAEISKSLDRIQVEMEKFASTVEDCGGRSVVVEKEEKEMEAEAAAARAAKRQRLKSGFRICKPQGTFLWPNMGGSAGSSSNIPCCNMVSPGQVLVQAVEDLLMVPTPPSVSSSVRPPQPLSPVKPLAEKRAVTVAPFSSSVVLSESACEGDNITPVNHHHPQHVFARGIHSFPSIHDPASLLHPSATNVAAHAERSEAVGSSTTDQALGKKQRMEEDTTLYASDMWLALATPSPTSLEN